MKRKTLESMREIRLWTIQVVVPIIGITMAIPELREPVVEKYKNVKEKIERKLNK